MKKQKIGLVYRGKKIDLDIFNCNLAEMGRGLMFRRKKNAPILMFKFDNLSSGAIHSFFVFFDFVAVWVDEENKVVEVKIVKPFRPYICSKYKWAKLIEIPVTKKYKKLVNQFF